MSAYRTNQIRSLVKLLYKDEEGKELILTDSQCEIFDEIFSRKNKRVHVMAHTRFGKSFVVALAVLTRISVYPEKWAIVAGTGKQSRIIIGYIIEHIFDNEVMRSKLEIGKDESLDRLRRERSKNRIVLKHTDGTFGEVFVASVDSRNKERSGNAVMGIGAANVIEDESSLIDDQMESKIFRMLGDSTDNFLCKIGNPFFKNHFYKSYTDSNYKKINIKYDTGIKEGRLTEEFIGEAKKKPNFSILYENEFPDDTMIDDKGWSNLITDKELGIALVDIPKVAWFGELKMGVDVARGGGCENVWVMKSKNFATIIGRNEDNDLMSVAGTTIRLGYENNINSSNWNIDDLGCGGGVNDRLKEQGYGVNAVINSNRPRDGERFENRRAENYWKLKEWLNTGGKLDPKFDWSQLLNIKYKAKDSSGRIILMSKDEMRKNGIDSPDIADALANTFDKDYYSEEELEIYEQIKTNTRTLR